MLKHPAIPWVLPFAIFVALLAAQSVFPVPVWLRVVLPLIAILAVSRPLLCCGPTAPTLGVVLGLAVFAVWVGPDIVWPPWRHSFLFDNALIPPLPPTAPEDRANPVFLFWRISVLTVSVPILEELFWRGWLMRWLINPDFEKVSLGTYAPAAFWITAALFASEHGPFWDVGLITGVIFNWWMIRTKNMWDCVILHATTNLALGVYVITTGHWEYL